jgi:hypothetical protein
MPTKRKFLNFWYIVVVLSIASALLWLYIDINSPGDTLEVLSEAELYSESIDDRINTNALELIEERSEISEQLLQEVQPYSQAE